MPERVAAALVIAAVVGLPSLAGCADPARSATIIAVPWPHVGDRASYEFDGSYLSRIDIEILGVVRARDALGEAQPFLQIAYTISWGSPFKDQQTVVSELIDRDGRIAMVMSPCMLLGDAASTGGTSCQHSPRASMSYLVAGIPGVFMSAGRWGHEVQARSMDDVQVLGSTYSVVWTGSRTTDGDCMELAREPASDFAAEDERFSVIDHVPDHLSQCASSPFPRAVAWPELGRMPQRSANLTGFQMGGGPEVRSDQLGIAHRAFPLPRSGSAVAANDGIPNLGEGDVIGFSVPEAVRYLREQDSDAKDWFAHHTSVMVSATRTVDGEDVVLNAVRTRFFGATLSFADPVGDGFAATLQKSCIMEKACRITTEDFRVIHTTLPHDPVWTIPESELGQTANDTLGSPPKMVTGAGFSAQGKHAVYSNGGSYLAVIRAVDAADQTVFPRTLVIDGASGDIISLDSTPDAVMKLTGISEGQLRAISGRNP